MRRDDIENTTAIHKLRKIILNLDQCKRTVRAEDVPQPSIVVRTVEEEDGKRRTIRLS